MSSRRASQPAHPGCLRGLVRRCLRGLVRRCLRGLALLRLRGLAPSRVRGPVRPCLRGSCRGAACAVINPWTSVSTAHITTGCRLVWTTTSRPPWWPAAGVARPWLDGPTGWGSVVSPGHGHSRPPACRKNRFRRAHDHGLWPGRGRLQPGRFCAQAVCSRIIFRQAARRGAARVREEKWRSGRRQPTAYSAPLRPLFQLFCFESV